MGHTVSRIGDRYHLEIKRKTSTLGVIFDEMVDISDDVDGDEVYALKKDGERKGLIARYNRTTRRREAWNPTDWTFIPVDWIGNPEKTHEHLQIRIPDSTMDRLLNLVN